MWYLLHLLGIAFSLFSLMFLLAAASSPISLPLLLLSVSQFTFIASLCFQNKNAIWRRGLLTSCTSFLLAMLYINQTPISPLKGEFLSLPGSKPSSILNRLFPEELGIFTSTKILSFSGSGAVLENEARGLPANLKQQYDLMREKVGFFSSPLFSTWLGLEKANNFDLLLFEEESSLANNETLIFLHGAGGNWSLLCWILADAAAQVGLNTACPSVGPTGNWNSQAGAETLEETIKYLKQKNLNPIYLAGLSNGAKGAARLINIWEKQFRGLILLFGTSPEGGLSSLPTLYIYGARDERFSTSFVEQAISEQNKKGASIHSIKVSGDHFALVKQKEEVVRTFTNWLKKQHESGKVIEKD